jgi:hypothetical protein
LVKSDNVQYTPYIHTGEPNASRQHEPPCEPGGRRIKKHVASDRRISIEDKDRRHGRKSRAKTFNGFKEHLVLALWTAK